MLRLTLAQMRSSAGRLAAAGVAILLGSAFVAVTLLTGNVIDRALTDSAAARYGQADLVVHWWRGATISEQMLSELRSDPAVQAADPVALEPLQLQANGLTITQAAVGTSSDPRLEAQQVVSGHLPTSRGEIALPAHVADQLGVASGGTVTVVLSLPATDPSTTGNASATPAPGSTPRPSATATVPAVVTTTVDLTVSGIVADPYGAFRTSGGAAVADAGALDTWQKEQTGSDPTFGTLAVLKAPGASGADIGAAAQAIDPSAMVGVQTRSEIAHQQASKLTGGKDVFTAVVLTFAAISLVVAALVIANTFQVLVAQRARMLALLRCVGATKGQVARSVVLEASALGALASAAGVAFGFLLGQVAIVVAQSQTDLPLPAVITPSVAAIVVPIAVGTAVTIVASLVPARAAGRVAPLAALRPSDAPSLSRRGGRARGVLALLLTVGGAALMMLGIVAGHVLEPQAGLAAGVVGGTASFVGVLLGAVFWMPTVVHAAGRTLGRFGAGSRLAAANTLRNPRRTTATASALLIGVTLVAMMSTGAATASKSLRTALDEQFPYDVSVDVYGRTTGDTADTDLSAADLAALAHVGGVSSTAPLTTSWAEVSFPGGSSTLEIHGVDPSAAASTLRAASALDGLRDGTLQVADLSRFTGTSRTLDHLVVHAATQEGKSTGRTATVSAHDASQSLDFGKAYVTPATQRLLDPDAPTDEVWLRVAPGADAAGVVDDVQRLLSDRGWSADVSGSAVERSGTQHVIDTLLRVLLGLLAVAVIIALIGVANTLSLSVIERRRESATLRALGLTRGQLRWMLAQEGMLIAGAGAVTGIVLGTLYGWAGASAALGMTGNVTLATPWATHGIVLGVALVAGLVASVLPGRSAARTPPVAALAVE